VDGQQEGDHQDASGCHGTPHLGRLRTSPGFHLDFLHVADAGKDSSSSTAQRVTENLAIAGAPSRRNCARDGPLTWTSKAARSRYASYTSNFVSSSTGSSTSLSSVPGSSFRQRARCAISAESSAPLRPGSTSMVATTASRVTVRAPDEAA